MSWSFYAKGKASLVLGKVQEEQMKPPSCEEPEQGIKEQSLASIAAAVGAYPDDVAVNVEAAGSMFSCATGRVNNLSVKVEPIHGLLM